ncbi:PilZ domain-containing protein [Agaribacterium sp. ZY112]|uniref:PilZ domain-containing protein n=1 Tax=Agaribacterium sp. ZY112 TaxID=3233574 RepID=UPI003524FA13
MPNDNKKGAERRDSFRIDEDVHFEFKLASSSSIEDIHVNDVFEDDDALGLINQFNQLDERGLKALGLISEKNHLLGDFLSNLNKKVELLSRQILLNSSDSLNSRPKTRVSLSEDGIGFICDRSLYKGSYIAMRLIFLPNYAVVSTYAQILRCVQKDEKYQVAAKFHQIYDKDRQTIVRQVMRSQIAAKKAASSAN